MNVSRMHERGAVDGKIFGLVVLGILFMGAGSAAIWLYMQYTDARDNVDSKVEAASTEAVKKAIEKANADFIEREKQPNKTFAGPDDYGHLTFDYPKTWNAYQSTVIDSSGDTYAVYFSSKVVPPVPSNALSDLVASSKETASTTEVSKFAVRLKIESKKYEDSLKQYEPLLKTGQLKSTAYTADSITGTRFDGRFNGDIRGSAVVIKIRDRTLTMRTDADVFVADFDKIIKTIKFNQ